MTDPQLRGDVRALLASAGDLDAKLEGTSISEARAMELPMRDALDAPIGELAVNRALVADTVAGRIPLRLFDARQTREAGPIMIFIHGGGWVQGSAEYYAPFCAEAARVLDLPVVAVDFRLAPEHPFPADAIDCEAAVRWITESPAELDRGPTEVVMCGDSTGGTLAIATCIALRDQPVALPVTAQYLLYPATDRSKPYASHEQFAVGYLLTAKRIEYVNGLHAAPVLDCRVSPLLAEHAGMPPTVVLTASHDPLRDEGRGYAAALVGAGVPVTFREARGNIHGFINCVRAIPSSAGDIAAGFGALKSLMRETAELRRPGEILNQ